MLRIKESEHGRYRIPSHNPFASTAGARKEIWAYGLSNPHRLTWDVDPSDSANNHLLSLVIGLHTWETVDIIHKGANYGYSLREGPQQLNPDNSLSAPPDDDVVPVRVDETTTEGTVHPTYPIVAYDHTKGVGGDAIASGFVYRGKAIPALRGKFLFGDITTGRIWWSDFKEMLAADDGDPKTMATFHEVKVGWNKEVYRTMAPVNEIAYHMRGGKAEHLPGAGRVPGGRSDVRLAMDRAGELYVMTKSDGVIRSIVSALKSKPEAALVNTPFHAARLGRGPRRRECPMACLVSNAKPSLTAKQIRAVFELKSILYHELAVIQ
jgi:hypothetical protein